MIEFEFDGVFLKYPLSLIFKLFSIKLVFIV